MLAYEYVMLVGDRVNSHSWSTLCPKSRALAQAGPPLLLESWPQCIQNICAQPVPWHDEKSEVCLHSDASLFINTAHTKTLCYVYTMWH